MKIIVETFVTIFMVSLAVFISIQFISIQLQTNNAKDLHATYISMVEASDFDADTIAQCQQDAIEKGVTLTIDNTYKEKMICSDCNTVFAIGATKCPTCSGKNIFNYAKDRLCTVKLYYNIKISVLDIDRQGVVNGYAR